MLLHVNLLVNDNVVVCSLEHYIMAHSSLLNTLKWVFFISYMYIY